MQEARRKTLFTQWLRDHKGIMMKVARSFTEEEDDLNDIFQEILVQIWLAIPSYRDHTKPSAWIYRIALNKALQWQRKEQKRRSRSIPLFEIPEPASHELEQRELLDRLYQSIRKLKPVDRSFVLLHLEGFSYQEIAEITGMTESNVGVRLNRAKHQLTEHATKGISHEF